MRAGTGSLPEGTGSLQGPSEPLCESGSVRWGDPESFCRVDILVAHLLN